MLKRVLLMKNTPNTEALPEVFNQGQCLCWYCGEPALTNTADTNIMAAPIGHRIGWMCCLLTSNSTPNIVAVAEISKREGRAKREYAKRKILNV